LPKIVMTLLVRDNADLLRDNIEFHRAQGIDYFIITDNGSRDETCDLAEAYVAQGLAELWHETEDTYDQARWVTRMARSAYVDHAADWVINNDADEFWTTGGAALRDRLSEIPTNCDAVYVERHNFPPVAGGDENYLQSMIYRETLSLNAVGSPLPGKLMHRGRADVCVSMGNHDAHIAGVPLSRCVVTGMEIHHFPVRTYADFEKKIVTGGLALQRNTSLPEAAAITWRRLYERWQGGGLAEWYEAQQLTPEKIAAGLAGGALTESTAVRDVLHRPLASLIRCPVS
jgi:hypothetical protein